MIKNYTKEDVLIYLDNIYKKRNDNKSVDSKTRTDIIENIENGCKITNLSESDLLLKLDFKPKDLTMEALEAFLAELRSIFWLRNFGFTDIQPLQARKKLICPDFTAKYKDKICAIEVFCLTQVHEQQKDFLLGVYKNFDPQFKDSKFGRDFMSKANNKKQQLDLNNVKIKILLCVINFSSITRLSRLNDIKDKAKYFYEQLNWGDDYYVGLNADGTNAIYPKID